VRYDQYGSAGNLAPPAEDLVNPFSGDPSAAEQGEVLFGAMNCDGCHGGGAVGFVGPSLVDGRWRYGGEDGALFHSIFYGRAHGMPAYGGILSDTTVWQLVSYVRSQPVPGVVPTAAWP
jgi:cytochrome c oxidase cbb3-type subunit 3